MRWAKVYEKYRNITYDTISVKHEYKRINNTCFYICQYSLQTEIKTVGANLARKFYLVKTYKANGKRPKPFNIKTGDLVYCYYSNSNNYGRFLLKQIIVKETNDVIYPHPCLVDKTLYCLR